MSSEEKHLAESTYCYSDEVFDYIANKLLPKPFDIEKIIKPVDRVGRLNRRKVESEIEWLIGNGTLKAEISKNEKWVPFIPEDYVGSVRFNIENSLLALDERDGWFPVRFLKNSLDELNEKQKPIFQGGRKPKYDWEAIVLEGLSYFYKNESKITQADLVRHLGEWCQSEFGEEPSESSLKVRAKKVLESAQKKMVNNSIFDQSG